MQLGGSGSGDSFVHLHLHTEFSMLDGAARVRDVIAAAIADGQPAIGITDHGNMYGVLDFYKEAKAHGVVPVIGTEAYMAAESRQERPVRRGRLDDGGGEGDEGEKLYYHLTLLAETTAGYRNLMKLSSSAYLEGYYYKPRCLLPGTPIVTRTGQKPIEEIEVGDEVLTHRGRFRRVTHTMSRRHNGPIYGLRVDDRFTWMTGEHPVLVRRACGRGADWVEAADVRAGMEVCSPALVFSGPLTALFAANGPENGRTVASVGRADRYDGPVFNIEVEDDHSYVGDFAMHNCDWELLERHHDGVIATTGCLGGVVLQALLKGDMERAVMLAGRLQELFGRDHLFVESQDYGLARQNTTKPQLLA